MYSVLWKHRWPNLHHAVVARGVRDECRWMPTTRLTILQYNKTGIRADCSSKRTHVARPDAIGIFLTGTRHPNPRSSTLFASRTCRNYISRQPADYTCIARGRYLEAVFAVCSECALLLAHQWCNPSQFAHSSDSEPLTITNCDDAGKICRLIDCRARSDSLSADPRFEKEEERHHKVGVWDCVPIVDPWWIFAGSLWAETQEVQLWMYFSRSTWQCMICKMLSSIINSHCLNADKIILFISC